jgi:hypothetical protein
MTYQQLLTGMKRQPFAYITVGSLVGPNSIREFTAPNGSQPNPLPPTFTSTTVSVVIAMCPDPKKAERVKKMGRGPE